ncbi:MAG: YccF domain-containing protein [Alistipes sp.]|nr:YccF domain-containing protein [Alistipes sp.]MBQ8438117.1 YccF domain-containing protein [Alistipes sp.]MBQ8553662.1 YccF domain-containing protein [Alistipes sp.]
MKFIGNIIWVLFGGLLISLGYLFGGLILCLTIVGIPFGVQIMRLGMFALWPFGGEVRPKPNATGCLQIIMNVLWIIFGGIEVALSHLTLGVVFCCTIIGIPFGLQHFKLMLYAVLPFGHEVVRE